MYHWINSMKKSMHVILHEPVVSGVSHRSPLFWLLHHQPCETEAWIRAPLRKARGEKKQLFEFCVTGFDLEDGCVSVCVCVCVDVCVCLGEDRMKGIDGRLQGVGGRGRQGVVGGRGRDWRCSQGHTVLIITYETPAKDGQCTYADTHTHTYSLSPSLFLSLSLSH